jgi:hypothetical protein
MMRTSVSAMHGKDHPHDPARRGYHVVYRPNETNHCPGCGRSHWYVGRFSAECGFCATALPLVEGLTKGAGLFRIGHNRSLDGDFAIAA